MAPKLVDKYTYIVTWSAEDDEFVGLCAEFPSLSWLAPHWEAAARGIRKVVSDVVTDMEASGERVPEPLSLKKFSGRFQVRILPEEHRKLAIRAAEEGVSLNRLVSAKLTTGHC
jgi:predicted HicB family RNase H-like nuclease